MINVHNTDLAAYLRFGTKGWMSGTILKRPFYLQDTRKVARSLIGNVLVHEYNGKRLSGIIIETEAYRGFNDTASHARNGPTERCKVMFGQPGCAYVYLTYGMYFMFNIVTEKKGFPAAVLIRAVVPLEGIDDMKKVRNVARVEDIASGPGKLTQALAIDKTVNSIDITEKKGVWVEQMVQEDVMKILSSNYNCPAHKQLPIIATPRIGIDAAGKAAKKWKWRFVLKDTAYASR